MPRWVWKEVPDISFFAERGYFHRFALRVPAWIRFQAEIMGPGLPLRPMAVVIYRDRPGIAWLLFKYWIGLENHLWGLREEGGTEMEQEIWNVTATPHLCHGTTQCYITFAVAFCLYRNGPGCHNWMKSFSKVTSWEVDIRIRVLNFYNITWIHEA